MWINQLNGYNEINVFLLVFATPIYYYKNYNFYYFWKSKKLGKSRLWGLFYLCFDIGKVYVYIQPINSKGGNKRIHKILISLFHPWNTINRIFLIREKTTKQWTMINKYSFWKIITLVKLWVSVKEGADIISL